MKFIHIVGFIASGKTTYDQNLRLYKGLINSTDKFPNKDGIGFYRSLLYKVKHKKNNILNCNACDWVFRGRIAYGKLLPELIQRNINTFVTSGMSMLFNTKDTEQLLREGHSITILYNCRTIKRCLSQYLKRCKFQKVEANEDSFHRYYLIFNKLIDSLKNVSHPNYKFIKLTGRTVKRFEKICKESYGQPIEWTYQRNVEKFLRGNLRSYFDQQYIDNLVKWGTI